MSEKPPFNLVESFTLAPGLTPAATPRGDRMRTVGHWLRDTGLGVVGFLIVLVVAVSGWTASFIGLHSFGMTHMGLTAHTGWLVPATFDGAPLGLSLVVFRASIHGRSATVWRLLIVVFTGLSSWINYQHINDPTGRWIASFMPPAAVLLFEGLMSEARAAAARRDGQERPRLHPLRWLIDREGTWAIYRAYVLGIELPDALKEAAGEVAASANLATESSDKTADRDPAPGASSAPDAATTGAPTVANGSANNAVITPAKKETVRRQKAPRAVAKKTPRRRSLDEWVEVASPIFHAEFERLRHNPTAHEFAAAIKVAGLGVVSDSTAKNIRAEILDRAPLPSLDGES